MKQKLQVTLLCLVFVGLSLWSSWPKGEPSWDGKTVSEWLVELAPDDGDRITALPTQEFFKAQAALNERRKRAQRAIRQLGTKALPFTLSLLDDPPPQPTWLVWTAGKVNLNLPKPPSPALRMARAGYAFEALGTDARPVLPTLAALLQDTNKVWDAADCLASIGKAGVPLLLGGLTNTHELVREACFRNIGRVGTNASAAVPTVLAAVNDANPKVARAAAFSYPGMEPDKEKVISVLVLWARSGTPLMHWALTGAKTVGIFRKPHGAEIEPLLRELLRLAKEPDHKIQASAFSALGTFGELAANARPQAVAALQSGDTGVRLSACHALSAFRQQPESSIPLLIELAHNDPDEIVRSAAVEGAAGFGEAGLAFCGPLRTQVEQAIHEREEIERLRHKTKPK